jgi:hypothetical protein
MEPKDVQNPKVENVESQKLNVEDVSKAKKKGSFFGDPVVIIE